VPSPDAHLKKASQFGGPGAAAMGKTSIALAETSTAASSCAKHHAECCCCCCFCCCRVSCRALRGGFVPSPDAHLETASQFGGPGAAAMGNMVEAVYGMFAGDGRGVERSMEHLTHGTASTSRFMCLS
jgi:hypothetical protein